MVIEYTASPGNGGSQAKLKHTSPSMKMVQPQKRFFAGHENF